MFFKAQNKDFCTIRSYGSETCYFFLIWVMMIKSIDLRGSRCSKTCFFEHFMYSHGLHLPRFHRIHFFENHYLRVTDGAEIRKNREILWVDRPLLGGIHEMIVFCKIKTTMIFNAILLWQESRKITENL